MKLVNLFKIRTNDEFSAFMPEICLNNADGFRWFNGSADAIMNAPARLG